MEDYLIKLVETIGGAICVAAALLIFGALGWELVDILKQPGYLGILGGDGLLILLALIALLRTMVE